MHRATFWPICIGLEAVSEDVQTFEASLTKPIDFR